MLQTDGSGRSPLFLATAYQHRAAVEFLLAHQADVNQVNSIGLSPFLMAVKRDDLALCKLLMQHKCNVLQVNCAIYIYFSNCTHSL